MVAPTERHLKVLFTRSRNRCAFPGCTAPIIEESDTVTGEICHIKAARPGGPRYDANQSEADRHSASNLILCCGRHHKLIDSEPETYSVQALLALKKAHEEADTFEIDPRATSVVKKLLITYENLNIQNNSGQIALNSPGAILAKTVNISNRAQKVVIQPPPGGIGNEREMVSYVKYLIDRFQEYQKADQTKIGNGKYSIIYRAIKREFKEDWRLMSTERFNDLVLFIQGRIDKTILGKINKKKGYINYQSFGDHSS